LVLLAATLALYFVDLGGTSIWDANEAFYVETPREMLAAHDLINPTFNGEPRFNKPVLSYWIVAGFYRLFGVSVGVQRFAIALGAMVIIFSAAVLARTLSRNAGLEIQDSGLGIPDPGSGIQDQGLAIRDSAAIWAAAGLAASPRLVMFARRIFIDVWITAFMSLTLVSFALAERYPRRRRWLLILMYVCVGLGTLTKGPVAIVLPALAFGVYLFVHREWRRVSQMMLPVGMVIVAAIVVPWYAVLHHQHGWTYIQQFFIGENLERYRSGVGSPQSRGILYYVPIVFTDSFPWSFLLVAAAVWWRRAAADERRIQTLLWSWIAVIVLFFSFSASKQDLYIYPIVPAVCALGGAIVARADSESGSPYRRWTRVAAGAAGALLALCGATVLYLFDTAGRVYALNGATAVGILGVCGGLAALACAIFRKPIAASLVLLIAIVSLDWIFVVRVLPDFERYKPVPALSDALRSRLQPGDVVAVYREAVPSLVYYLRRHVDVYADVESFQNAMAAPRRVYGVLRASDYVELRSRIARPTCVIDRRPTFDVRLGNILRRESPPELLLISNQCSGTGTR
jgi:4-amino-4-deoxy-L-arabinose transferase-like glycosyltransferase